MTQTYNITSNSEAPKFYDIFSKEDATALGEKIWDEIIKSVPKRSPDQLIPLVNELFHQSYHPDSVVTFLSTEYPALHKQKHSSIFNDITFQINQDKIYHLESQIKNESDIIIRMIEYNFSIALQHDTQFNKDSDILTICIPDSAVIYPTDNKNLPKVLHCQLIFPDGHVHPYDIPTIHVQDYSLDEIHAKHLNLFLPYTLLRFRSRLNSKQNPLTKNELTEFMNTLILNLEDDVSKNIITTAQYQDYLYLIDRVAERIFSKHAAFRKEVSTMTECKLVLPSERMEQIMDYFNNKITELNSALTEKEISLQEQNARIQYLEEQLANVKK